MRALTPSIGPALSRVPEGAGKERAPVHRVDYRTNDSCTDEETWRRSEELRAKVLEDVAGLVNQQGF